MQIDNSILKDFKIQPLHVYDLLEAVREAITVLTYSKVYSNDCIFNIYVNSKTFYNINEWYVKSKAAANEFYNSQKDRKVDTGLYMKATILPYLPNMTIYVNDNLIDFQFTLVVELYTSNTDLIILNK